MLAGTCYKPGLPPIEDRICLGPRRRLRLAARLPLKDSAPMPRRPLPAPTAPPPPAAAPLAFIVEDGDIIRHDLRGLLEDQGWQVADYASAEAFLEADRRDGACLVLDVDLPGISGLALLLDLRKRGRLIPTIMITGSAGLDVAVEALKAGASDFMQKPIQPADFLACIARLRGQAADAGKAIATREDAVARLATLSPRQRIVMDMVLDGHPSKNIAADLGLSQRTVENHRASIMRRTKVKSLPALARLVAAAAIIAPRAAPPADDAPAPAPPGKAATAPAPELPGAVNEDQFERFFDGIPLAVVIASTVEPERMLYANPAFEKLSGQTLAAVAGQPWASLPGRAEQADIELPLGVAIAQASDFVGTFQIDQKDGTTVTVEAYSNIIADDNGQPAHRLAVLVDVTGHDVSDRQKFEQVIREKDTQLQEIQHRVKNNLQLITALVRIEARNARGRIDTVPFDRLAGRINALQTLYSLLSTFGKTDEIDLGSYLSEIVSSVMRAHAVEGVSLDLKVDSFPVSVNVALPIGLVANELLTNAVKHAFVGRAGGTITLRSQAEAGGCRVVIADDGIGLPEGVQWPKRGKLGELIVRSLRQNANADLRVESRPGEGTRTTITFTRTAAAPEGPADAPG